MSEENQSAIAPDHKAKALEALKESEGHVLIAFKIVRSPEGDRTATMTSVSIEREEFVRLLPKAIGTVLVGLFK